MLPAPESYLVDVRVQQPVRDDVADDLLESGLIRIDLVLTYTDEAAETRHQAGSIGVWLLDPYHCDILADADSYGDALAEVVPLIYANSDGDFHAWWPVEYGFGRALFVDDWDVDAEERRQGAAMLALRRAIQLFSPHLVVAFARGRSLRRDFKFLGFTAVNRSKQAVLGVLAGDERLQSAVQLGGMFLNPERRGPVNEWGWEGACGKWDAGVRKAQRKPKRGTV